MTYDPTKHHRRSIRLKGYDYHQAGSYFITICTKNRECVFEDSVLNMIVNDVWKSLPLWFPTITLDEFVVMPNHVHFILWIVEPSLVDFQTSNDHDEHWDGDKPRPYVLPTPQKINMAPALCDVVGAFKSLSSTVYLNWLKSNNLVRQAKFWQTNYYEHIIRNEMELDAIRQYIINNPINWEMDRDNSRNKRKSSSFRKIDEYLEDVHQGCK